MPIVRAVDIRPGDRIIGADGRTVELVADVDYGSAFVHLHLVPRSAMDIGTVRVLWASDDVVVPL